MKKKLVLVLCTLLVSLCAFTACGNSEAPATPDADITIDTNTEASKPDTDVVPDDNQDEPAVPSGDTLGVSYLNAFNSSSATDPNAVVDELLNVPNDMGLVKMDVEPGYLNGFDNEITGFNTGVVFSPMIGSIPFVGYVFETSDTDALIEELTASANLRWNICTEADEMVYSSNGNLVFFMMCSNE